MASGQTIGTTNLRRKTESKRRFEFHISADGQLKKRNQISRSSHFGFEREPVAMLFLFFEFSIELCSVAIVVLEHSAKSLTTFNLASDRPDFFTGFDDLVTEPLMVAFLVIIQQKFGARFSKRSFAKEDHSVKTF